MAGSAAANLVGRRTPLAPRVQATVGATWMLPFGVTLDTALRLVGTRFEDDLNTLRLGQATLVDVYAARRITRSLEAFAAFENLTNATYDVGRTPLPLIGLPRVAHVGLRLSTGR